jgi:hypothetical protein
MGQHQRWARCPVYGTAPEMGKMHCLWGSTRDGQDALPMGQHQRWERCPVHGTAPEMGKIALFIAQEFVSLEVFKTQVILTEENRGCHKEKYVHRSMITKTELIINILQKKERKKERKNE